MLPCVFSPAQCTALFLTLQGVKFMDQIVRGGQVEDRFLPHYLNKNLLSVTYWPCTCSSKMWS